MRRGEIIGVTVRGEEIFVEIHNVMIERKNMIDTVRLEVWTEKVGFTKIDLRECYVWAQCYKMNSFTKWHE